ncbi:MAG: cysteine--tRNA ligase [Pseudomonadota bacterium]|nr:cysteine--tRNA ligase [Pseudomonadota bacterium]
MIRLYDTMTREKRPLVPINPQRITMYVCGPTVYGRAHIGNARPAVVFDTLARLIRHEFGPASLVYARNVTDVDDKIINSAREEDVDTGVITERYERFYLEDMGALGVSPPTIAPHATQEIPAMIAMIERLVELGHAYEAQGHVLFHVPSDPSYGILSGRDREAMLAGARVEVAPYKRDPADFVLWKPSEEGVVGWDSPWGRGRPGWHIECSAMIRAHLGETIDIHGGGLDLIFPHHENEVAQSRCAHRGIPLARHWVHNGFVDMGAEKMSKSLGNVITVDQLLAAGHRGEVLRLALLSAHYRSPLPWTDQLVAQSKAILDRWYRFLQNTENTGSENHGTPLAEIVNALSDDLNTPQAIAEISKWIGGAGVGEHNVMLGSQAWSAINGARLLGLLNHPPADWFKGRTVRDRLGVSDHAEADIVRGEQFIEQKIAERAEAKKNRDFATADRIREELKSEGILLEDGASGTTWRRE